MWHFFESVLPDVVMGQVAARVADDRALKVVRRLLNAGVGPPGVGLPIGNLTSQHFGDFVLGHLDHHAREGLRVAAWVRHMDDVMVFGPDKPALWAAHDGVEVWLRDAVGLALKDAAKRALPIHVGVPFLALSVWPREVAALAGAWRDLPGAEELREAQPQDATRETP